MQTSSSHRSSSEVLLPEGNNIKQSTITFLKPRVSKKKLLNRGVPKQQLVSETQGASNGRYVSGKDRSVPAARYVNTARAKQIDIMKATDLMINIQDQSIDKAFEIDVEMTNTEPVKLKAYPPLHVDHGTETNFECCNRTKVGQLYWRPWFVKDPQLAPIDQERLREATDGQTALRCEGGGGVGGGGGGSPVSLCRVVAL
ncbi:hypothetical protein J6590_049196 [Homalodisca vitripennis]|nr:hypothetical protein J6590_049196 [Homalodisca vitripennis]